MPEEIVGIHSLEIPVIARCGDPVDATNAIKFHEKWKIDYYISFYSEEFFHELYPKILNTKQYFMVLNHPSSKILIRFKIESKTKFY